MSPSALQPVAAALAQGNRPEANRLLQAYLTQNPLDEGAWLWLSQIAIEPAVGAESLVRVLETRAGDAGKGLPGGHTDLAKRLRRLADVVERPPRGPQADLQTALAWAGRGLIAVVLIVVALVLGPLALGDRPIVILSGSMEPFFHTGSIVMAQPVPSAGLNVGDVIAYLPSAESAVPIVHRIVGIREEDGTRLYTTRGDANDSNDPLEVPLAAIAWRYWYSVPLTGYIVLFAAGPNGRLAMIGLPLLGLLVLTGVEQVKRRGLKLPAGLLPIVRRLQAQL